MAFDSMIYTLGTALNRAMDSATPVEVLVHGQWISGSILVVDGHGLVLESSGDEHYFVRVEQISAVRVMGAAPMHDNGSIAMGPVTDVPAQRPTSS